MGSQNGIDPCKTKEARVIGGQFRVGSLAKRIHSAEDANGLGKTRDEVNVGRNAGLLGQSAAKDRRP